MPHTLTKYIRHAVEHQHVPYMCDQTCIGDSETAMGIPPAWFIQCVRHRQQRWRTAHNCLVLLFFHVFEQAMQTFSDFNI